MRQDRTTRQRDADRADARADGPLYGEYCHVLSPTIGTWCPLRATDVSVLRTRGVYCDGKELYYYGNHPIKWVRLSGIIVAIELPTESFKTKRYILDDSSGECIECACVPPPATGTPKHVNQAGVQRLARTTTTTTAQEPAQPPSIDRPDVPWDRVRVGTTVKVQGKVSAYPWGTPRIDVIRMTPLSSTEQEVRIWDDRLAFHRSVLARPWSLTPAQEHECHRRAAHSSSRHHHPNNNNPAAANRRRHDRERHRSHAARLEAATNRDQVHRVAEDAAEQRRRDEDARFERAVAGRLRRRHRSPSRQLIEST